MVMADTTKSTTPQKARGWRERIEPGLYRSHRLTCPSSQDRRPGRRCACAFQMLVPGQRTSLTRTVTITATLSAARRERRRLMAAGRPPALQPRNLSGETLDEFAATYFRVRSPLLAGSTIRTLEEGYRLRVAPVLGRLRLGEITRERVEVWLGDLIGRSSSRQMVAKPVASLRSILGLAVEWGHLPANPAAGLRLPPLAPGEGRAVERVLTQDELRTLLQVGARTLGIETMFRAAAEAGLRKGEVIGLRWPDVDLPGRRLEVQRSIWQERGRPGHPARKIEKGPKSGRVRRVAISEHYTQRLAAWHHESVLEAGADPAGWVWPGRDGGPMGEASPGQTLERALIRVGLLNHQRRPLVTFHGLRHTAASIMLARGVPLIVVSRQLGHANPQITATVYAHLLSDSELDRAAAVFEEAPNERPHDAPADAGDRTAPETPATTTITPTARTRF